ncbi:recombinase family protein [Salmonella enterica]|uniref:recombinase family protein n=1 Tax=Salmonella enterica TaxID=28901 RepID=UPI00352A54A0
MLIGYVRVSTNDQNTDLQRNALNCAGCERIFEDKISGTKSDRPGLKRHCCKVSDEAAFCLIQRPYISKTLLTRRISPRGSP